MYLDSTVLTDFQATEATNEKRDANYGMIDLVKDSTPAVEFIPPDVAAMLKEASGARSGLIPVFKDQTVEVGTVPGFDHIPINIGETDTYFFTAVDVFSGFRFYPASFKNNQVRAEWFRTNTIRNILKGMAVVKDNYIETVLEARKTQVLGFTTQVSQSDGTFVFNAGTDTLEINKAAQKDTMFTYLNQLMTANQLPGNYRIVTSPGGLLVSEVEAMKHADQQAVQRLWSQSAVPFDMRYTSDQIVTAENFNGFFVKDGVIGMYSNHPYDFVEGTSFAGKQWSISDVELPYIRSQANIYINTEATNAEHLVTPGTDTNLTMTHFEEMAIWDRFYIVYKYNSDLATRQNDIVKLLGKTT